MTTIRIHIEKRPWIFWGVLISLGALILMLGPEEQTLGTGIRSVYVHVALIWVGIAGLALSGLLGLIVLVTENPKIGSWMQVGGWVGSLFYAAGVGMSLISSKVNWGSVFWQEPRMQVALNMLAVIIVVQVVLTWTPWLRVRGALSAMLIALLMLSTYNAPLVLHPRNPIGESSSSAIQLTFLGLTAVAGLGAVWLTWFLQRRYPQKA